MSHVLQGFSINRQVEPTAGYRLDVLGAMRAESETAGDTAPYLSFVGFGANSADTDVLTGDRDPNGLVSALPGSLYLRGNGVTSNLYVNISVGPGPGTSWTTAGSLGAVPTWSAVLGAGNTSGGTDAVMSNGDELRWEDGAAVTRRSDDLAAGEPRTRFFTAAAALSATLSVATATGVLSYTDDLTLDSVSPLLTEGNDGGSPTDRMRKSDAGSATKEIYSAGFRRWTWPTVDAVENCFGARYDGAGVLVNIFLAAYAASSQTDLTDTTVSLVNANSVFIHGTGGGSPVERYNKSAGGETFLDWYDTFVRRWILPYFRSNEDLEGHRYSAAGVFVNLAFEFVQSGTVAASVTTFGDRLVILSGSGGSVTLQVPNHYAGESIIQQLKSDADVAFHDIYSATVQRMRFGADAAENLYWQKFTGAGALETEIAQFAAGFVRMQTHFGITDGITAPAALAGYAKFYVDTVDGDYKMIFGDGIVALLAPDNVPTQAWPMMWRDTTDLTVAGNVGETNIFTRGIPAGMLLANGAIRLKIGGDLISESAAATIQLRVYFGATLLYDVTTNPVTTGAENNAAFWFVFELHNQNATNAQRGNGCWGISPALNATVGVGGGIGVGVPNILDPLPFTTVAGALDTTAAQTLRVTITWAGGNATDIFTRRHNFLQISPLA